MELTYPINFIGYEDGDTTGEVVTRHGECLGKWTFTKDEENETGAFHFVVDGETDPQFTEGIGLLSSGRLTGLALSTICRSIRVWHEEKDQT